MSACKAAVCLWCQRVRVCVDERPCMHHMCLHTLGLLPGPKASDQNYARLSAYLIVELSAVLLLSMSTRGVRLLGGV